MCALSDITNRPTVDTTQRRTAQRPQTRAINSMTVQSNSVHCRTDRDHPPSMSSQRHCTGPRILPSPPCSSHALLVLLIAQTLSMLLLMHSLIRENNLDSSVLVPASLDLYMCSPLTREKRNCSYT